MKSFFFSSLDYWKKVELQIFFQLWNEEMRIRKLNFFCSQKILKNTFFPFRNRKFKSYYLNMKYQAIIYF